MNFSLVVRVIKATAGLYLLFFCFFVIFNTNMHFSAPCNFYILV